MTYKKKLIEVSLPLPEVNDASAYDKMPGIGPHPKGIHHWWARLPLPTARAVLFASVVDDPSGHPEKFPTEVEQNAERERLFGILRRMMQKKLHESVGIYAEARNEMLKSCDGQLPVVYDPFAGGGSIPLEANRLGFEAHAGDLNPVAVVLNKCNLEIAPRWSERPPVNPEDRKRLDGKEPWPGTRGLAADVRYYGRVIRDRARQKIGHLYRKVRLPREYGGGEANVIAWIWARTVASPNPAARGAHVPLISTFWLSSKKGNEAWLQPVVDKTRGAWRLEVRTGSPGNRDTIKRGTKNGSGGFTCLLTDAPITFDYIRSEGAGGRLGFAMVAVVADLGRSRVYLPPTDPDRQAASQAIPSMYPDTALPEEALGFRIQNYGIRKHWQMFSARQLTGMVTLSDLVKSGYPTIREDAAQAGLDSHGADEYARAITTFLGLVLDRCADFNNAFCRWKASGQQSMQLFGRQAIPMVWDFVEPNLMGEKAVCWHTAVDICADAIEVISPRVAQKASARQIDAADRANGLSNVLISTDPPYYDNIGYAALSDFFYIWLRRTIADLYPALFGTVLVPKVAELTASPERFDGDKRKAKEHFESGFRSAFKALGQKMDRRFPLTVYYAFKQADEEAAEDGDAEIDTGNVDLTTGWETLLEALITSGFQITATWPVRASQAWRMRAMGSNALASYIVLACRPRPEDAPQSSRREFLTELRKELPPALKRLQQGNVAPVDFAQAAIGPGMAVYSRYSRILESATGARMSVRTAIGLINQVKNEVLGEAEADYDPYTRWAITWYDQHGFEIGEFGDANTLANAHAVSVNGLRDAGIVEEGEGDVRLLRPEELDKDWNPDDEERPSIWRMTHQLVRCYFVDKRGDIETATLLRKIGSAGEAAKDLAYRLFSISKPSQDTQGYNALVLGWPEIARLAQSAPTTSTQPDLI